MRKGEEWWSGMCIKKQSLVIAKKVDDAGSDLRRDLDDRGRLKTPWSPYRGWIYYQVWGKRICVTLTDVKMLLGGRSLRAPEAWKERTLLEAEVFTHYCLSSKAELHVLREEEEEKERRKISSGELSTWWLDLYLCASLIPIKNWTQICKFGCYTGQ